MPASSVTVHKILLVIALTTFPLCLLHGDAGSQSRVTTPADPVFQGMPTGKEVIPPFNASFERRAVELTNEVRARKGLPALKWDEDLANAARYHAADMFVNQYFDHHTFDRVNGKLVKRGDAFARIRRFAPTAKAENLYMSQGGPEEAVNAWIASPGHRKNIMNRDIQRIGVGYRNGYWVQIFASQ